MKFCEKCGSQLSEGMNFCPKCGDSCNNITNKQPEEGKRLSPPSKQGKPLWFIISIALILALIGGGWFLWNRLGKDYSLEGLARALPNYDAVFSFHDGMARVYKGEKYGYINMYGDEIIPCKYVDIAEFTYNDYHEGLACVYDGNFFGYIDKKGKNVIPFKYEYGRLFSEGYAWVMKSDKYGLIDKSGKEITPFKYTWVFDFSEGLAFVYNENESGFIDTSGNLVIKGDYSCDEGEKIEFHEGLACVFNGEQYGFIDKKGTEVIPYKYSNASQFSDGLACVISEGKMGFINKTGKEVIPCKYYYDWNTSTFAEEKAFVRKDEKHYYCIDTEGNELFSLDNEIYPEKYNEGVASISFNNKHGFIDEKGKEVIPVIYDYVDNFSEGLAVVERDGRYGYIDKRGMSTFDVHDEKIDTIIAKKEKERAKLEELGEGVMNLYNLTTNKKLSDEVIPFTFKRLYGTSATRGQVIYVLYLYPSNESSGEAHFVQFHSKFTYSGNISWIACTQDAYNKYFTGKDYFIKANYEAKNNEIHIKNPVIDVVSNKYINLSFEVSNDGMKLKLKNQGWLFNKGAEISDPL